MNQLYNLNHPLVSTFDSSYWPSSPILQFHHKSSLAQFLVFDTLVGCGLWVGSYVFSSRINPHPHALRNFTYSLIHNYSTQLILTANITPPPCPPFLSLLVTEYPSKITESLSSSIVSTSAITSGHRSSIIS